MKIILIIMISKLPLCLIKLIEEYSINYSENTWKHRYTNLAENGSLKGIQWLHKNNMGKCLPDTMDWAARNGHLDIVKWLHFNRREGCTFDAMNWAAWSGHLEVVKWLHHNRPENDLDGALEYALNNDQETIMNWLKNDVRLF